VRERGGKRTARRIGSNGLCGQGNVTGAGRTSGEDRDDGDRQDQETGQERGFGFILGSDGAELFFHRSALQGKALTPWRKGKPSSTMSRRGDKGPRAANMKVVASGN